MSNLPNIASYQAVNHSIQFVNPVTGVHAQNVESYWNRAKIKLKRMRGCHEPEIAGYLDKFMCRERHGKSTRDTFNNIISNIRS